MDADLRTSRTLKYHHHLCRGRRKSLRSKELPLSRSTPTQTQYQCFKTYYEKRTFAPLPVNFNRIWVIHVAMYHLSLLHGIQLTCHLLCKGSTITYHDMGCHCPWRSCCHVTLEQYPASHPSAHFLDCHSWSYIWSNVTSPYSSTMAAGYRSSWVSPSFSSQSSPPSFSQLCRPVECSVIASKSPWRDIYTRLLKRTYAKLLATQDMEVKYKPKVR